VRLFDRLRRERGDQLVLAVLLGAGIVVATLPRADATRIFHNLLARGNQTFLNTFDWAFDLAHLARENRELRSRVAELSLRTQQLEEAERQNARLRALQEFEEGSALTILTGAEVIGWGDGRNTFTLTVSAGARDGVERDQAVVTAEGLVGRIDRAPGVSTAIVSLLSDPSNAVAALLERTREQGIFQFIGAEARLVGVRQSADVRIGDRVLSSGLGGVYPGGLLIGEVVQSSDDPDGLTKRLVIRPAASLDRLEEVFILRR